MLIAHASQHFDETESAFVHAVGLAAQCEDSEIITLHVTQGDEEARPGPRASRLLARWSLPEARVRQRLHECPGHDDVPDELIKACESLRPELVVLSTHARKGLARVLAGSVAEAVARNVKIPTLLLPIGGAGFVDADTGALDLARLLVLGGSEADAQLGVDASAWLLRALGQSAAQITLLHVEDGTPAPVISAPASFHVQTELRAAPFEQAVASLAQGLEPKLVVMVSHGHDGLLDVLVSNHTERVLHDAKRPLLWVPPEWKGAL